MSALTPLSKLSALHSGAGRGLVVAGLVALMIFLQTRGAVSSLPSRNYQALSAFSNACEDTSDALEPRTFLRSGSLLRAPFMTGSGEVVGNKVVTSTILVVFRCGVEASAFRHDSWPKNNADRRVCSSTTTTMIDRVQLGENAANNRPAEIVNGEQNVPPTTEPPVAEPPAAEAPVEGTAERTFTEAEKAALPESIRTISDSDLRTVLALRKKNELEDTIAGLERDLKNADTSISLEKVNRQRRAGESPIWVLTRYLNTNGTCPATGEKFADAKPRANKPRGDAGPASEDETKTAFAAALVSLGHEADHRESKLTMTSTLVLPPAIKELNLNFAPMEEEPEGIHIQLVDGKLRVVMTVEELLRQKEIAPEVIGYAVPVVATEVLAYAVPEVATPS